MCSRKIIVNLKSIVTSQLKKSRILKILFLLSFLDTSCNLLEITIRFTMDSKDNKSKSKK